MSYRPAGLDHVNLYVRDAERSHRWYTDILGLHTQDVFTSSEAGKTRAVAVPFAVSDHTISIGLYVSDPDGNGLEAYYELPRSEWHREKPSSGKGDKGRFPGPWDEALQEATAVGVRA